MIFGIPQDDDLKSDFVKKASLVFPDSFTVIVEVVSLVTNVSIAVDTIKLADKINETQLDPDQKLENKAKIRQFCHLILKGGDHYKWQGKTEDLVYLLDRVFLDSEDKSDYIQEYIDVVLNAYVNMDVEVLERNAFLNGTTLSIYYKILFKQVIELTNNLDIEEDKVLDEITKITKNFHGLISFIQKKSEKNVISIALKQGKKYLDLFSKKVFPILSSNFKYNKDKIVSIFTVLQKGTRLLQYACNDTKMNKDSGLMASVPPLKRSLEQLLYLVKGLVGVTISNLKYKDVSGKNVSSQLPVEIKVEKKGGKKEKKGKENGDVEKKSKKKQKAVIDSEPVSEAEKKSKKGKGKQKAVSDSEPESEDERKVIKKGKGKQKAASDSEPESEDDRKAIKKGKEKQKLPIANKNKYKRSVEESTDEEQPIVKAGKKTSRRDNESDNEKPAKKSKKSLGYSPNGRGMLSKSQVSDEDSEQIDMLEGSIDLMDVKICSDEELMQVDDLEHENSQIEEDELETGEELSSEDF